MSAGKGWETKWGRSGLVRACWRRADALGVAAGGEEGMGDQEGQALDSH